MTSPQFSLRELRERNTMTNYPTMEPGELLALVEAVEAARKASPFVDSPAYGEDESITAALDLDRKLARFKDYGETNA